MATRDPGPADYCAVVDTSIDPVALAESVRTDASGAVALFAGTVRNHHEGRRVDRLEYEAYAPMAEAEIRRIVREARARWDLHAVAVVHRIGMLEVGETSVAVAVSAAHRREALEACSWTIDRIKESVPVWKKEHGEAGAGWVLGDGSCREAPGPFLPPATRSRRRRDEA